MKTRYRIITYLFLILLISNFIVSGAYIIDDYGDWGIEIEVIEEPPPPPVSYEVNFSGSWGIELKMEWYETVWYKNWWEMDNTPELTPPSTFNVKGSNETIINLSFNKIGGTDRTHICRKEGSYPTTPDDSTATVVYNNTGVFHSDTGLDNGTRYYYSAWAWNKTVNIYSDDYSTGNAYTGPGKPTNIQQSANYTHSIVLSWTKGYNASRTLIRYSDTSYPTKTDEGSFGANTSLSTATISNLDQSTTYYFSMWGYLNPFSDEYTTFTADTTSFGTLEIWVYKETQPWIQINNYTVFITNEDGTQTYENVSVNNPHYVNLSEGDLPIGEDILVQISKEGYHTRIKYMDLYADYMYNVSFYLPPDSAGGGNESEPDYIPPESEGSNESENESYASHYIIVVNDEQGNSLKDVKVTIKRYINTTGEYESIYILYTDGHGEIGVDLIPYAVYQIILEKTGYVTEIARWSPPIIVYSSDVYKYFILEPEPFSPHGPDVISEQIIFTAIRSNRTIFMNYTDKMENTTNLSLFLYEINGSNINLIYSINLSNNNSFNINVTYVNKSCDHKAVLYYNHTNFGMQRKTIIISREIIPLQTSGFDYFFGILIGYNPFGWGNLLIFLFLVAGLYYADERDAPLIVMLLGGIFLFLNIILGFNSTLFSIAGGVIPGLFFVVGIIGTWANRRKTQ